MRTSIRFLLPFIAACAFSGCLSGNIGVQGQDAPGSDSSTEAPSASAADPGSYTQRSTAQPQDSGPVEIKTLFFATVQNGGASIEGLDFLSVAAQSPVPFFFFFPAQPAFSIPFWRPVVYGQTEQLSWIEQSASESHLVLLDPHSLQTQDFAQIPAAQSWDIAWDMSMLAGITQDGKPFLQNLSSSSNPAVFGKPGLSASAQVQWIAGTQELAVVDPTAQTIGIFSANDLQNPVVSLSGEAFSASPSGKVLLIFSQGKLAQFDRATNQSLPYAASLSSFSEPRWNGDGEVAYVDSSAAATQVSVLNVEDRVSTQPFARYPVTASSAQIPWICPAWMAEPSTGGMRLFFAGQGDAGVWSIWQSDTQGAGAQAFSVPSDSEQGWICPKGANP